MRRAKPTTNSTGIDYTRLSGTRIQVTHELKYGWLGLPLAAFYPLDHHKGNDSQAVLVSDLLREDGPY